LHQTTEGFPNVRHYFLDWFVFHFLILRNILPLAMAIQNVLGVSRTAQHVLVHPGGVTAAEKEFVKYQSH